MAVPLRVYFADKPLRSSERVTGYVQNVGMPTKMAHHGIGDQRAGW